jgi:hypothetical protein
MRVSVQAPIADRLQRLTDPRERVQVTLDGRLVARERVDLNEGQLCPRVRVGQSSVVRLTPAMWAVSARGRIAS